MIIEGKHAEVGQGIFISDIQDGSVAQQVQNFICGWQIYYFIFVMVHLLFFCFNFQAGLNVGDMILAVNKDDLLGSNYDTVSVSLIHTSY